MNLYKKKIFLCFNILKYLIYKPKLITITIEMNTRVNNANGAFCRQCIITTLGRVANEKGALDAALLEQLLGLLAANVREEASIEGHPGFHIWDKN